jgi:hypothetical protein
MPQPVAPSVRICRPQPIRAARSGVVGVVIKVVSFVVGFVFAFAGRAVISCPAAKSRSGTRAKVFP